MMCEWAPAPYLFFSENVFDPFIYYSHLVPVILSLAIGLFVFFKDPRNLANRILFFISVMFSTWVLADLVLWASDQVDFIMFFWSILILIEPIIYLSCVYLTYVIIDKKDVSLRKKVWLSLLLVPTMLFVSTKLALLGFDFTNCDREAIEGPLPLYGYLIEVFYTIWLVLLTGRRYRKTTNPDARKQIALISTGIFLFLFTFSWGNIVGSLSSDWALAQYGLFGMPVFIGFLGYVIIRFKTFNAKTLGANMLVTTLCILVFSLLFIQDIDLSHIITAITFVLLVIFSVFLVKSVRSEVKQREEIEKLAKQLEQSNVSLEKANVRLKELDGMKTEFLSLASHQIRNPLTAIKGYASLILDGTYGKLENADIKAAVEHIFTSTESLVVIVSDFLDISRIEAGTMKYDFSRFDLGKLVGENVAEIMPNADKKGLKLAFNAEPGDYMLTADIGKIKQVVGNLIDNSIKYTPKGSVDVTVTRNEEKKSLLVKIADTGVGIPQDVLPTLFHKFARARDAHKTSVTGTGLGLYVAKRMIEAHKGRIWVESQGKGMGSQFYIELPVNNTQPPQPAPEQKA